MRQTPNLKMLIISRMNKSLTVLTLIGKIFYQSIKNIQINMNKVKGIPKNIQQTPKQNHQMRNTVIR